MENPNDIVFDRYRIPGTSLAALEAAPPQGVWKKHVKALAEACNPTDGHPPNPRKSWRMLVNEVMRQQPDQYGISHYKRLVDHANPVDGFANQLADYLQLASHSPLRNSLVQAERGAQEKKAQEKPSQDLPTSRRSRSDGRRDGNDEPDDRESRHDHVAADLVPLGTKEERAALAAMFDEPHAPANEGESRRAAARHARDYMQGRGPGDTRNPYSAVHALARRARSRDSEELEI